LPEYPIGRILDLGITKIDPNMEKYPALEGNRPYFDAMPIRWGMIGCGAVTELKSAPALYKNPGFELRTVMGRNPAKVEDYARRHGISLWTVDAAALITDPEIDAVYIATPPDSHLYYARMVAEAGKPCCVEKPMAPTLSDGEEMYRIFKKANLPLFVSYYRRSLPRFNKVKDLLENGRIGTPLHIHWTKTKAPGDEDRNRQYSWRTDPDVAPGGYFDDLACHGLDLFAYLLGDFSEVSGQALNQLGLYAAPDAVTASWVHEGKVTGTGFWNFAADRHLDEVRIYGEQGVITFSVLFEAPISLSSGDHTESWEVPNPEHIQEYHMENMRLHLRGERPHPSTAFSALHTQRVMDRILKMSSHGS